MAKSINKTIAVLMVALMALQNLVLWPPCGARQNEAKLSLRAVVPLPRAVGVLPESTGESDFGGYGIHRCRNPDSKSSIKRVVGSKVATGYRPRDEPFG